jgi:sulfate adenylyltransferase
LINKNFVVWLIGLSGSGKTTLGKKIFETIQPEGIEPFLLNGPHYCSKCNSIVTDKICKHSNEFIEEISGTKMRQLISEKKYPPEYYMRKEICDIIFETKDKFL